jgi:hypothetical protein
MRTRKHARKRRRTTARKPSKQTRRSVTKLTRRQEENRLDAFAALALMRREGLSASSAAEVEGTTVKNIRKYAGSALRKRGKDYVARRSDRLIRKMNAIDKKGLRPIVVRSSKAASTMGRYFNAVDDALNGKPAALKEFRGKKVPYNRIKFLTNLKTLRKLKDAGVLDNLKDIYWHGRKR